MKRFLQSLKAFAEHPATQLATGLILLISGGAEIVYDFRDAEQRYRLGMHHGVALFGLVQMLGSLPAFVEGLNHSFSAVEKQAERKER